MPAKDAIIGDSYPLTPMQQGMLFHTLLGPGQGVYIQQFVCALSEPLDFAAFARAWEQLAARHDSLRTAFDHESDPPRQIVYPVASIPWARHDWRGLPLAEQSHQLEAFLHEDRLLDFDLSRPPLFRLTLFRFQEEQYQLVWTSHHSILDGRSRLILIEELFDLYEAACTGRTLSLPPATAFRPFVEWLRSRDFADSAPFWRTLLAGHEEPAALEIGASRPGEPPQPRAVARKDTRLSSALSADLRSLAANHELTLNTLLQGAWAILMSRYSGHDKVIFGATRSGRGSVPAECARAVGLLINTVPVPVEVHPDVLLLPWLKQLRAVWVAMRPHEHTPMMSIRNESRLTSDRPLFESLVGFENYQLDTRLRSKGDRWLARTFHLLGQTSYPLVVQANDDDEIPLKIEYDPSRFSHAAVDRLLGHLRNLLAGFVLDPNRTLGELPILGPEETRTILGEGNAPLADCQVRCIHHRFAEQVKRTPGAVAVIDGDRQLTYEELNEKAHGLAHHLRELGVGPEVPVGLCLARPGEMIVGMLAVLKSGGVCLPLDPDYPVERLRFMLEDVSAPVVLTEARLRERLPSGGARILALDERNDPSRKNPSPQPPPRSGEGEQESFWLPSPSASGGEGLGVRGSSLAPLPPVHGGEGLGVRGSSLFLPAPPLRFGEGVGGRGSSPGKGEPAGWADQLAYVLYTSGSTGRPKGAAITHRAIHRLVLGTDFLQILPSDRVGRAAPFSFDAALFEVWGPLLNGGVCVCMSREVLLSPRALAGLLREQRISVMFLTTSLFHQTADALPGAFQSLRRLLVGGELLDPGRVRAVLRHGPPERLVHVYGPTESTTFASWHTIGNVPEDTIRVPIGTPVAGTELYVLDRGLHLAPAGIAGELFIGGSGLARGYVHRPDLTAERFVPHPFRPGQRLYRTGDQARWREDGSLEFLGRLDRQIKVRGHRVEPGEIESALLLHPDVRQAVVAARTDAGGSLLVAYVVAVPGHSLRWSALRDWLRQRLPDYLVPGALVVLDALPLTPTGKIDRNALLQSDPGRYEREEAFTAPGTPEEAAVAAVFSAILGRERVCAHDDFFELGGHSLLAAKVIARAGQALGVDLPLISLFETPTPAGLARRIDSHGADKLPVPPLVPVPRTRAIPLAGGQRSNWDLDKRSPGLHINNTSRALRLIGPLRAEALRDALEAIVIRHEALRTTFSLVAGSPVQEVHATGRLEMPIIEAGSLGEAQRLFDEESLRPFDLANDPMLRAALLRLGPEEHVLLISIHHIVIDGWSLGIFLRELAALYGSLATGAHAELPELPIQPADFACWEQLFLSGPILDKELGYWKKQLSGATPTRLKGNAPPALQNRVGSRATLVVPPALTGSLRALGEGAGCTPFMTLLAGYDLLLHLATGQEHILIASPLTGRTRPEISGLIGCFRKMVHLRTDLSGAPTFRELLGRVRETALGAYAHQDVPLERLLEDLPKEPDLSFGAIPMRINLLDSSWGSPVFPGLQVSSLELSEPKSRGMMALYLAEQESGLHLKLVYERSVYSADRMRRFLENFRSLLQQIVAAPDKPLRAYQLDTPC